MGWLSGSATVRTLAMASLLPIPFGTALATTAADLCLDADPCVVSQPVTIADGSSINLGTRALVVASGGRLDAGTGSMRLTAREVTVEDGGELRANGLSTRAGRINVSAETINVAGVISANGSDGGFVSLVAAGSLVASGAITANGTAAGGFGGEIALSGGTVTISGNLSANAAADSLGGCVTISAGGDLLLRGTIRLTGGDGGDLVAVAGGLQGGNLMLQTGAALIVDGLDRDGGSAGAIDLTARGDGLATGHVLVDAGVQAFARGAPEGDGGCIAITAAGEVTTVAGGGSLDVSGGSPDGFAGEISMVAERNMLIESRLVAQGSGSEGIAGDIILRASLALTLGRNARLSAVGADDGGTITLSVDGGELTVLSPAVDVSGTLGGDGGEISIRALNPTANVIIAGALFADGSNAFGVVPGRGGVIDIAAGHALTVRGPVTAAGGRIQAQGGSRGQGGTVTLATTVGDLVINGAVVAPGLGPSSVGGTIALSSGGELAAAGVLDASADRQGGMIGVEASRTTTLSGTLTASGLNPGTALGGAVEIRVDADLIITGNLSADGASIAAAGAGAVSVQGCDVTIETGATLSARGNEGRNRVVGREQISIAGNLLADLTGGHNDLVFRDPLARPLVFATATVVPPHSELLQCAASGIGAIIGAIAGGGKGAAIGAIIGGGAGTAGVMTQRGRDIRLERGQHLKIRTSTDTGVM